MPAMPMWYCMLHAGNAGLATTTQATQTCATSGTVHVPAHDDKPLLPSDPAIRQHESSNKAHSNSNSDSVSAEDGGSSGASPTALLPDEQTATSPNFQELAPAGRDDAQREDKHHSLRSKQFAMQGTRSDGSKQMSSRINTPVAAANADSSRETPSADQDDIDGSSEAGLSVNGQGNGHQQMAKLITEGDAGNSAQSGNLHAEDDSLADDNVVRAKARADIALDNGESTQTEAVMGNQRDDTGTVESEDVCKSAEAGAGQKKKKNRGSKKKKKTKS